VRESLIKTVPTDYQEIGMRFLVRRREAILGFKTGLGKSLTLLCAIDRVRCAYEKGEPYFLPVILFAPKNAAIRVWPKQIPAHTNFRWTSFSFVLKRLKNNEDLETIMSDYDIIIVRYSEVSRHDEILRKMCHRKITAYDEIHQLKTTNSQRTIATKSVTATCVAKWGLSATTVLNSPLDLFGVLQYLDSSIFGNLQRFKWQFCKTRPQTVGMRTVNIIVDFKNLDKLEEIRKKYVLSVSQDIEVKFHKIPYVLTEEEDSRYMVAAMGMVGNSLKDFGPRLPDIQRICDGSMDEDGEPRYSRCSKYKAFAREIYKVVVKKKQSVIVFAEYYKTIDYLETLFRRDFPDIPQFIFSGKKVREPNKFPCIVLATAGGSESLNLRFANHVFFYSIPFSVGAFIQILGRITRMDSEFLEDLHAYLPENDTTIDCYKTMLLDCNASVINQILGHDANLPKSAKDMRRSLLIKMRKKLLWRESK